MATIVVEQKPNLERDQTMGKRGPKPAIEVRPTLPPEVFDAVNEISYVTDTPLDDIGLELWRVGMVESDVFRKINAHFRYEYEFRHDGEHVIFFGGDRHKRFERKFDKKAERLRLSMYFTPSDIERLDELAHALRIRPTTAAGLIVEQALSHDDCVLAVISKFIRNSDLDRPRRDLLRKILDRVGVKTRSEAGFVFHTLLRIVTDPVGVARTIANNRAEREAPKDSARGRANNPYADRNKAKQSKPSAKPSRRENLPSMFDR